MPKSWRASARHSSGGRPIPSTSNSGPVDRHRFLDAPFLRGEKVSLRSLRTNDITGPWFGWFHDPEVTRFMHNGAWPNSVETLTDYYERIAKSRSDLVLAIIDNGTSEHVGNVGIHDINWLDRKAEVGIVIGAPGARGKGFGSEAIRLMTRHAFERLGLHKLTCGLHVDNIASKTAFESAGFHVEARLRDEIYRGGRHHDSYRMGVTAPRYFTKGFSRVVAIVEARVGSTRLPGKVMKPVLGRPVLELLLERLRRAELVDDVVIATSNLERDEPLASLASRVGVGCYRGSENDVMGRVLGAAMASRADVIVGITGDCPFVDPDLVDTAVEKLLKGQDDYVCNFLTRTFPDGLEVQAYKTAVLEDAASRTQAPIDREHVTHYIHERPAQYRLANFEAPPDLNYPGLRLDLDLPEDLEVTRSIYEALYPANPRFTAVDAVQHVIAHPAIREFDRSLKRLPKNAGSPLWEEIVAKIEAR